MHWTFRTSIPSDNGLEDKPSNKSITGATPAGCLDWSIVPFTEPNIDGWETWAEETGEGSVDNASRGETDDMLSWLVGTVLSAETGDGVPIDKRSSRISAPPVGGAWLTPWNKKMGNNSAINMYNSKKKINLIIMNKALKTESQ